MKKDEIVAELKRLNVAHNPSATKKSLEELLNQQVALSESVSIPATEPTPVAEVSSHLRPVPELDIAKGAPRSIDTIIEESPEQAADADANANNADEDELLDDDDFINVSTDAPSGMLAEITFEDFVKKALNPRASVVSVPSPLPSYTPPQTSATHARPPKYQPKPEIFDNLTFATLDGYVRRISRDDFQGPLLENASRAETIRNQLVYDARARINDFISAEILEQNANIEKINNSIRQARRGDLQ